MKRHRRLGQVWLACFAIPLGLACIAALQMDLLLTRLFADAAWAPLVALAALVELATARRVLLGVAAALAAVALVLPAGVDSPSYRGPAAIAVERPAGLDDAGRPHRRATLVARPSAAVESRFAHAGVGRRWTRRPFVARDVLDGRARRTPKRGACWLLEPIDYDGRAPRR